MPTGRKWRQNHAGKTVETMRNLPTPPNDRMSLIVVIGIVITVFFIILSQFGFRWH